MGQGWIDMNKLSQYKKIVKDKDDKAIIHPLYASYTSI